MESIQQEEAMKGNMLTFSFVSLLLLVVWIPSGSTLDCLGCPRKCLDEPKCCDSGYTTHDVCGCCKVCAQPVYGKCGGSWGFDGACATGLQCVRVCGEKGCFGETGTCVKTKWIRDYQFVLKTVKVDYQIDEAIQMTPIRRCKRMLN